PLILPDVADVEITRRLVERIAPRIAQTVRPDLRQPAAAAEWISRRGVRTGCVVHVEPEHLAEERARVLTVAVGAVNVAAAAAVADARVEKTVGTEADPAAGGVVLGVVRRCELRGR